MATPLLEEESNIFVLALISESQKPRFIDASVPRT